MERDAEAFTVAVRPCQAQPGAADRGLDRLLSVPVPEIVARPGPEGQEAPGRGRNRADITSQM